MELIAAAEDVHQELDDSVHWRKGVGKENESNDDGELLVEAKGLVQGFVVDKHGEEGEDVEEMGLWESIKVLIPTAKTDLRDSE